MPFGVLALNILANDRPARAPANEFRMEWMVRSPDMSLVEDVWAQMTVRVNEAKPTDRDSLVRAISDAWRECTTCDRRRKLFEKFPSLLAKCIVAEGDNTFHESRRRGVNKNGKKLQSRVYR